jgi:hypothetical protein
MPSVAFGTTKSFGVGSYGWLGMTTPLPDIQVFLRMDPRLITLDIPAGRIVISPIHWEPFFPGGATIATGRFLTMELDDVEFDGDAARAYIMDNLLPSATPSSVTQPKSQTPKSPAPSADGYFIPIPYRTGMAGRPTSWSLIEAECRHRYAEGVRHPNDRTKIESRAKWARELIAWLKEAHKGAPVPKEKTLTNRLGALLSKLKGEAPSPTH